MNPEKRNIVPDPHLWKYLRIVCCAVGLPGLPRLEFCDLRAGLPLGISGLKGPGTVSNFAPEQEHQTSETWH